jgi:hypothetical protein
MKGPFRLGSLSFIRWAVHFGGIATAFALLLSTWVFSFNAGRSVIGAVGLTAAERTILFDVQMKAAAVGSLVQVVCGVVLLAAPRDKERHQIPLLHESEA